MLTAPFDFSAGRGYNGDAKEERKMKPILKSILAGVGAMAGGLICAALFAQFFDGMGRETGAILGMGCWLCLTAAVCTGVILARLEKRE